MIRRHSRLHEFKLKLYQIMSIFNKQVRTRLEAGVDLDVWMIYVHVLLTKASRGRAGLSSPGGRPD